MRATRTRRSRQHDGRGGRDAMLPLAGAATLATLGLVGLENETNPLPLMGLFASGVGAFLGGRALGRRSPTTVPWLVVGTGLAVQLVHLDELTDRLAGPLGYANATAAYHLVCAGAALVASCTSRRPWARRAALAAAAGFAVVPWLNGSRAGALLSLLVLGSRLPAVRRVRPDHAFALAVGVVAGALAVTTALGLSATQDESTATSEVAAVTLGSTRLDLWHRAIGLAAHHPVVGAGFGAYGAEADREYEHYAHNDWLQLAGEGGVATLALALLWVGAAARQTVRGHTGQAGLVALATTTAVSVHATVDYVGHFPAVVLPLCLLVGSVAGSGEQPPANLPGHRDRPAAPSRR